MQSHTFRSIEVCAGAGGSALGLEQAGFAHDALVEIDPHACQTLRHNRPKWNVFEQDLREFDGKKYSDIDLLSGGVPCPPFSVAGKQLGSDDDRDLFPEMIRLTRQMRPRAVLIENVPGIMTSTFDGYRDEITRGFHDLGFVASWHRFNSSDFGVSQLRPRVVVVVLRPEDRARFTFPPAADNPSPTVGELLVAEMSAGGWLGATDWAAKADTIAPTLVGGSKRHGGPDLGPTRAKQAWAKLGVDGRTLADEPPSVDHSGMPRLTVSMAARLQGFPSGWAITGKKTNAYRQVGNAFPPPVARAVGLAIRHSFEIGSLEPSQDQTTAYAVAG